ncbi:MAG: sigma factor [Pseudomonadota bacterium]
MTEEQIAAEALGLIRKGEVEAGAELLVRRLTTRVQRYFERHRVPADQAEELVSETWLKLVTSRFDGGTREIVWLWTVAKTVLLDWVRRTQAQRRSGTREERAMEVQMDDDGWALLAASVAGAQAPAWTTLCIERAAWQFEQDEPRRAEVLRFSCEQWSAEEIAMYYGAEPPVTDKQKTAARNRVLDAMKRARGYFEHCREAA